LSSLHGPEVRKFEKKLAKKIGVKYAVAVNSGTSALQIALRCLYIGEGDEVIVPNMTFMATASAVKIVGAEPVLVDIVQDGLSIDPDEIRKKITDKTKAIIPVHLAGVPALMDKINEIAMEYNLHVIEDACQALGSKYMGQSVGTISDIGCFSFYPSKLITTGEGGMLVTNDGGLYQMACMLRNHGRVKQKQRASFVGYNYRMPEICAAMGNVYMRHFDYLVDFYKKKFCIGIDNLRETNFIIPKIPEGAEVVSTYIPFCTPFDDLKIKSFYKPLNNIYPFCSSEDFPNSNWIWNRTDKYWLD